MKLRDPRTHKTWLSGPGMCIPISAERYRNRVLERQLQDMARSHAREKQGLMTKLEDLK